MPIAKRSRFFIFIGILAVVVIALGFFLYSKGIFPFVAGRGQEQEATVQYHCPMHPTVVSDKPGDCPICNMRLVPIEKQMTETAASAGKKKTMYRSTMNPGEISDKPGKDSMGMDMEPFEVSEGEEPSTVSGLASVSISPEARQRMGLTLGAVERRMLSREIRTSARIVADETQLFTVTTKVEGWVDTLFINVTGQKVKKGEPLLTIYSPQLVSAQQEYLTAMQTAKDLARSSNETVSRGATQLLEAAAQRLQLWDVSDEQIKRLEQTGRVEKNLTLYASAGGWVIEKNILAGQKIMPGDPLLVIADLTRIWADADIYQSDLPYVKVGMAVEVTIPDWEGKMFNGKVAFITPTLDSQSRTVKARLDIANPEFLLKPELYADAHLTYSLGETLAIPEGAVMRTGEHVYAFKEEGNGRLVPVEIMIGPRAEGYFQLLSGLSEGDRIATSANFLVDSESQLKAALEAVAKSAPSAGAQPPGGAEKMGGHKH